MNTFTPQTPGSISSSPKIFGVLAGGADIKGEVAMHAVMAALDLVGDGRRIGGERIGVGHLEHRRDAAEHRAARAAFQVLLVGQARLAEMHLAVDHARQHMQAAAVDHLTGGSPRQVADRRKPAGPNTEVAGGHAVLIDHGAALEDQVVGVSHARPSGLSLAQQRLRSAASSGKRFGMKAALLPDRGVVKVAGEDARRFLNGLASNDMGKVAPGQARFAALLTPQGKIIVDFIAAEAEPDDGGGFFLDCPRALAATLVEKLNFYKLRAKIAVENLSDALGVMAVWDGAALSEDGLSYPDPRLAALGTRSILPPQSGGGSGRRARRHPHRCRSL